jgi:ubiquinone/menaquinone biosynthesis C-methylase UbiE
MVRDHFSSVAPKYAECRPSYPSALTVYLGTLVPSHQLAWDCGTGSGQAARILAEVFERVHATDPSDAQLRHALPHPRVEYRKGVEAASGLPDESCDLVTAAQAAHWFDLPAFYREVDRVLRPRGVLAVWGYAPIRVSPLIDPIVARFEHQDVGPYWPKGRELATNQYRDLPFPYRRLDTPAFTMERQWSCAEFLGYLGTWSAVDRYRAAEGKDPVADVAAKLEPLWGPSTRLVAWPLHLLAGRKP